MSIWRTDRCRRLTEAREGLVAVGVCRYNRDVLLGAGERDVVAATCGGRMRVYDGAVGARLTFPFQADTHTGMPDVCARGRSRMISLIALSRCRRVLDRRQSMTTFKGPDLIQHEPLEGKSWVRPTFETKAQ
jgi:hypothetical protein